MLYRWPSSVEADLVQCFITPTNGVWRWHSGNAAEFARRVIAAIR
jgi:hypothetical protein